MIISLRHLTRKILMRCAICAAPMLFAGGHAIAQRGQPHAVTVSAIPGQGLNFGAFTEGSTGGTVTLLPTGNRIATGDVILFGLGHNYAPALFEIEAEPGTVIAILKGPDALLTGSAGGSLSLNIGMSNPSSPMITTAVPPARTLLSTGGTLTVGSPSANPPGHYSGYFYITIIRE